MNVTEAIKARHSTRAFLSTPVAEEDIAHILETARWAPSGVNMQPWQVAVVQGQTKQRLQEAMVDAFYRGQTETMDYHYYPTEWKNPYKKRRTDTGKRLYEAIEIERGDQDARRAQWAANYRSFDAPVAFFFFMDPSLETGSYLDYGMFLQNIMLLAAEKGLATCPQGALAEFPRLVKTSLGYDESLILLGGMALGYEDTSHPVNRYRTPRETLETFTRFFDKL